MFSEVFVVEKTKEWENWKVRIIEKENEVPGNMEVEDRIHADGPAPI